MAWPGSPSCREDHTSLSCPDSPTPPSVHCAPPDLEITDLRRSYAPTLQVLLVMDVVEGESKTGRALVGFTVAANRTYKHDHTGLPSPADPEELVGMDKELAEKLSFLSLRLIDASREHPSLLWRSADRES